MGAVILRITYHPPKCVKRAHCGTLPILGKPVVITNYPTSGSQLENGVDGVIVPQDNAGCAEGIIWLLQDPEKMAELQRNCANRDYSNAEAMEKLYALIE